MCLQWFNTVGWWQKWYPACSVKSIATTVFRVHHDNMVVACCLQARNTVIIAGGKLPWSRMARQATHPSVFLTYFGSVKWCMYTRVHDTCNVVHLLFAGTILPCWVNFWAQKVQESRILQRRLTRPNHLNPPFSRTVMHRLVSHDTAVVPKLHPWLHCQ